MALTIPQMKAALEALLGAFVSRAEFERVLLWEGYVYADLTSQATRETEYFNIIRRLNADGTATRVLIAAHHTKPENGALQALASTLSSKDFPAVSPPPLRISDAAEIAADDFDKKIDQALQRTVNASEKSSDTEKMIHRLSRISCQTGAIEIGGNHQGTCFLIGPDVVLTNHHVIDPILSKNLSGVTVRFDRFVDNDGVIQTGFTVPFRQNWHIYSCPHDPADTTGDPDDVPASDMLDFALVRLTERASDRPCPNSTDGKPRGWAKSSDLANSDIPVGNVVSVIQYPNGAPRQISPGNVLSYGGSKRRVRYSANTKGGSSGSPVIDGQANLVALHHAGDPNFAQMAEYNQGIPLKLIAAHIVANGLGGSLV